MPSAICHKPFAIFNPILVYSLRAIRHTAFAIRHTLFVAYDGHLDWSGESCQA
jgi:hypothetical protein